ncbi:hypothetical protein F7R91_33440 [Streptomyces luteolifulvus]|uniref:Uncharacterized protein n=1 Tax=Streptomyces luteolifulvus TaxID=2615112 RepID=A0A6H9UQT8_9ACTN|nr:hypothetical protein [Streptomyces luteolifulvus]KAB1141120.1 hypothetical protein F7R91_33440 [Streptomyces luteolifulvus]
MSTLDENGIATGVPTTPDQRSQITWNSEGAVDITFKASGQSAGVFTSLADAQAGALVAFSRGNSVLVAFRDLVECRLPSQPVLATTLIRRYWAGTWPRDWCVVSHLVTARSGTILVAGEKGSVVELAANASAAMAPTTLVDIAAHVGVTRSSGLALELLGEHITPFFRVLRLRRRFLRGIDAVYGDRLGLRTASGRQAEVPADILEEVQDTPEVALESPIQPIPEI